MKPITLILFLTVSFLSEAQIESDVETIFDRKASINKEILEVPFVPRYEEKLNIKGRYEAVGDVNLWVEVEGEGTPLVLISGGPGTSHHYFHPHMEPEAEYAQVIYYDMRGVGLSDYNPGESGYNVEQAVDDLEGLRVKLGVDKWVVLGLSFGGIVAQLYAVKYPHNTLGMIYLSSALPMSIDVGMGSRQYDYLSEEERNRIGEIYQIDGVRTPPVRSEKVGAAKQREMLFNAFSNGDWKRRHIKKWTVEDMAMYARYEFVQDEGYYGAMFKDYFEYDLKGVFMECPIPTLIIEGKWDLAFSDKKAKLFFEQFPNAEHVLMENCGHLPFEDEPEKFHQVLKDFMVSIQPADDDALNEWISEAEQMNYRNKNVVQQPLTIQSGKNK
ncbi:MAG: alpha/beta hydrolase [Cyclobacteriaceae bacterium]